MPLIIFPRMICLIPSITSVITLILSEPAVWNALFHQICHTGLNPWLVKFEPYWKVITHDLISFLSTMTHNASYILSVVKYVFICKVWDNTEWVLKMGYINCWLTLNLDQRYKHGFPLINEFDTKYVEHLTGL